MKKVLLTEINRMREIMNLKPLILEAVTGGRMEALRLLWNEISQIMGKTMDEVIDPKITQVNLGDGFKLPRETFERTREMLYDMRNNLADITESAQRGFTQKNVSDLIDLIKQKNPQVIEQIEYEFLTDLSSELALKLNRKPTEVGQDVILFVKDRMKAFTLKNNTPTNPYDVMFKITKEPFLSKIFADYFEKNEKKIGQGTFTGPLRAPKVLDNFSDFDASYRWVMRTFEPSIWQKWKQRWLVSIGLDDPDVKTFFRHSGEFFRSHETLIKTIEHRLDVITTLLSKGKKAEDIMGELDLLMNSIGNMKKTGQDSLKKYYLKYIVENKYLPPEMVENFKNSDQWKVVESMIEKNSATALGNAMLTKLLSYPKMIPGLGIFIESALRGINPKKAAALHVERWTNFLNSANTSTIAELRAINAQGGLIGDQISWVVKSIIFHEYIWPYVDGFIKATIVNRSERINMIEEIQTLKKICAELQIKASEIGQTYDCTEIENLSVDLENMEVWNKYMENVDDDLFLFGDGSIKLKDIITDNTSYDDVRNLLKKWKSDEFKGIGAPEQWYQDWLNFISKFDEEYCKILEKNGDDCTKYKTSSEKLKRIRQLLDDKKKGISVDQRNIQIAKADSTARVTEFKTASGEVGFKAFIKLYNEGLDENQQLKPLCFCNGMNVGYSKHKTTGEEKCWNYDTTQHKYVPCSTSIPGINDWRQYCKGDQAADEIFWY
jgi:hypothetical protein